MVCKAMQMWNLSGLVAAFLDLSIAYLLLCASALAFIASKFLGFFGLSLPCPCDGLFFSIPFKDNCFSRMLVDFPTQKVSNVHYSVKKRFPFDDSMWARSSGNYVNKFIEMEGEASCSSVSDSRRRRNVVDREELSVEKYDVKGKGVVIDHRPRSRLRKRRKGGRSRGYSSVATASSYDPFQSEDGDSNKVYVGGARLHLPKYVDENNVPDEDMRVMRNIMAIERFSGDEMDRIRRLEQELEEERDAHTVLYTELEKERSAAASAADEAMAMILRLQEEKASIGMEARQYQRILEEKSTYDAEEMDILKEILMKREREKLFLEKEVEAYCQIVSLENKQSSGNFSGLASDTDDDPQVMLRRPTEPAELPLYDSVGNMKLQEKEVVSVGNDSCVTGMGVEECKFVERSEEKDENQRHKLQENVTLECNSKDAMLRKETRVYDIHVIGDPDHELNYDSKETSVTKKSLDSSEVKVKRSNSDISGLPPVGPKGKLLLNSQRSSISAVDSEMLKIDVEVSNLRERLKVVRDGRDKLSLSVDNREGESRQLKLLEDITRQIQEIRYLTEPGLSGKQLIIEHIGYFQINLLSFFKTADSPLCSFNRICQRKDGVGVFLQDSIQDPKDDDVFSACSKLSRDPLMVQNIWKLILNAATEEMVYM